MQDFYIRMKKNSAHMPKFSVCMEKGECASFFHIFMDYGNKFKIQNKLISPIYSSWIYYFLYGNYNINKNQIKWKRLRRDLGLG
jgi:hypothetical protein